MKKKEFQNLPSTKTPINAENLNEMQSNIEESCVIVSPTEPTTNEKVWLQKRKNLLDYNNLSKIAKGVGIIVDDSGNISDTVPTSDGRAWTREYSNWTTTLPKGTYTVSLVFSTLISNTGSGMVIFKNGEAIFTKHNISNLANIDYTFTLEEEVEIGIELKVYDGVCTIQLEEGSTATEYQAYMNIEKIHVRNNNGIFEELDVNSKNTIYEGALKGGESVVLSGVKRFLDVYFRLGFAEGDETLKYVIDTGVPANLVYSGTITPAFDNTNGLEYYVSESKYDKTNNTFTHTKTGYFNIQTGTYTSRSEGNQGYAIYRIDTYDN